MTAINADVTALFQRQGVNQNSLSEEQKSSITDILSKYDPENLSDEDVESIKEELKEAGVRPSPGLKSALEEAGFDAEAFRPAGPPPGGAGGPPSGPPPGEESTEASEETLKTLASIFEEYDLENLDEDDLTEIQKKLQEAGISLPGSVINQTA